MSAPQVNGVPEGTEIDGNDASSKKKFNHAARDLEKVTDYAEEKEVISPEQFQGVSNNLTLSIFSYFMVLKSNSIRHVC